MIPTKPECGHLAIQEKKLAIFGSRMGYAGPVIQDYTPFENEVKAIEEARAKIVSMGLPVEEDISRPFIRSMRMSYGRRRKK